MSLNPFKTFLISARHMKIHEKDPASGLLPVSPPSPTKRRRPSIKRRQEEDYEEPPTKKVKMKSHANEKCGFQIWTCWKNQELLRTFWGFFVASESLRGSTVSVGIRLCVFVGRQWRTQPQWRRWYHWGFMELRRSCCPVPSASRPATPDWSWTHTWTHTQTRH